MSSGCNAPGTSHGGNNLQMGQNYGPLPTGMPHQNSGNYSHNSTGLGMFENNAMAQPTASNYGYGTLPNDIAGANTGTVGNYAIAQHQYNTGNLLIGAGENNNTGHQPTSLGVAVAEQGGNSSRGMPTGPGGLPMGLAGSQNQRNTDGLPMGLAGSQNQPNTDGGYFEDCINQLY